MIAYGGRRRSGFMNCIGITRLNKGSSRKCVGLAYVSCDLDDVNNLLTDVNVSAIEIRMEHYCLMLPLIDDGNFDKEFAIIYDDWDVANERFQKCLPNLCAILSAMDVLA